MPNELAFRLAPAGALPVMWATCLLGTFALLVGCSGGPDPQVSAPSRPMPNSPGVGLPNPHEYLVTDAVVTDQVTGLEWQRDADAESFAWADAADHCAELELFGRSDWRLPSRLELVSLLDLNRINPAIGLDAFPDAPGDWFWTSSRVSGSLTNAWYVYFYFGYPDQGPEQRELRARCVRGDLGFGAAKYEIRRETVRDQATGLRWQRNIVAEQMVFADAESYCATLELEGRSGYRLPSMQELQSLVDETTRWPAIDSEVFPDVPSSGFWASSLWADSPDLAWQVSFQYGAALYDLMTNPHQVRCVL